MKFSGAVTVRLMFFLRSVRLCIVLSSLLSAYVVGLRHAAFLPRFLLFVAIAAKNCIAIYLAVRRLRKLFVWGCYSGWGAEGESVFGKVGNCVRSGNGKSCAWYCAQVWHTVREYLRCFGCVCAFGGCQLRLVSTLGLYWFFCGTIMC